MTTMSSAAVSSAGSTPERRYERVAREMAQAITQGRWRDGEQLADERKLAMDFGVSRTTIRQALDELAGQGLIQRQHGRGTFVRFGQEEATSAGCICVLAVGQAMRFNSYVATVIAMAEASLRTTDRRLVVRYEADPQALPAVLQELDSDPLIRGGLLVGEVHRATLEPIASQLRVRWVKVGDYAEATRPAPVIDHVVGDNHALARLATQHLRDLGRRDLALFVQDERVVWSRDMISAFRTILDDAGVAPAQQRIADLADLRGNPAATPAQVQARLRDRMVSILTPWISSGHLPQGVILPRKGLEAWQDALEKLGPAAAALRSIELVVWDFSERRQLHPARPGRLHVAWVLTSLASMIDDAVARITDPSAWGGPEPQRRYHSHVQLEPASDAGSSAALV